MEHITTQEQKGLYHKLLEFELKGLSLYGKYLEDQLEQTPNTNLKKYYKQYLNDQVELNNQKVSNIELKLAS